MFNRYLKRKVAYLEDLLGKNKEKIQSLEDRLLSLEFPPKYKLGHNGDIYVLQMYYSKGDIFTEGIGWRYRIDGKKNQGWVFESELTKILSKK